MKKGLRLGTGALVVALGLGMNVMASGGNFRLPAYNSAAQAQLEAEKMDGIVVVTKTGCPVCAKQVTQLESLLKDAQFANLKVQQLNLKDPIASEKFKVSRQSTIIVYKDGVEVSRTTGETDADKIKSELLKAI